MKILCVGTAFGYKATTNTLSEFTSETFLIGVLTEIICHAVSRNLRIKGKFDRIICFAWNGGGGSGTAEHVPMSFIAERYTGFSLKKKESNDVRHRRTKEEETTTRKRGAKDSQFYGLSISFVILEIRWGGRFASTRTKRGNISYWRCLVLCVSGACVANEEWRMIEHQFHFLSPTVLLSHILTLSTSSFHRLVYVEWFFQTLSLPQLSPGA